MLEEGILDPAKVTRLALQNVASIAGLPKLLPYGILAEMFNCKSPQVRY